MERDILPANPVWLRKYPIVKISQWVGGYRRNFKGVMVFEKADCDSLEYDNLLSQTNFFISKRVLRPRNGRGVYSPINAVEINSNGFGTVTIGKLESQIKFANHSEVKLPRNDCEIHATMASDPEWRTDEAILKKVNHVKERNARKLHEICYRKLTSVKTLKSYFTTLNSVYLRSVPELRIESKIFPNQERKYRIQKVDPTKKPTETASPQQDSPKENISIPLKTQVINLDGYGKVCIANSKEAYSITFPNKEQEAHASKTLCEIYLVLGRSGAWLPKIQILKQIEDTRKHFSSELGGEFKEVYGEEKLLAYISSLNKFLLKNYRGLRIMSDARGNFRLEKIEPYYSELNSPPSNKTNEVYLPTV